MSDQVLIAAITTIGALFVAWITGHYSAKKRDGRDGSHDGPRDANGPASGLSESWYDRDWYRAETDRLQKALNERDGVAEHLERENAVLRTEREEVRRIVNRPLKKP